MSSTLYRSWCREPFAHTKKLLKLHSGEVKVLVISGYYAIFAMVLVTTFILPKIQDLEELINDITVYFACEATGTLRDCEKPSVELYGRIVSIVAFVLVGLNPIVNLVFVINTRNLKRKISKYFSKIQQLLRRRT